MTKRLTVAMLRHLLAVYPDDTEVRIYSESDEFEEVAVEIATENDWDTKVPYVQIVGQSIVDYRESMKDGE